MRAALYTPMNAPERGPPSGDRAMAGQAARALVRLGFTLIPGPSLRSYDASGSEAAQRAIADAARREADYLIKAWAAQPPDLFLAYHSYYKAPDHIGPALKQALRLRYAILETSYAGKRATGPFAFAHHAARAALDAADAVGVMTAHDAACLSQVVDAARLMRFSPFIDPAPFLAAPPARGGATPVILTVAMMRPGKKLDNFPVIAAALAPLLGQEWRLDVAGDGPGRALVEEALLARLPKTRVRFLGRVPHEAMPQLYASADIYLWPGLKEAYGLSYLEAQASGLPVVAFRTAGVPDVIAPDLIAHLAPPGDVTGLSAVLAKLLAGPSLRSHTGEAARRFAASRGLALGDQQMRRLAGLA